MPFVVNDPSRFFRGALLFVPTRANGQTVVCSRAMPARACEGMVVVVENELRRLGAPSGWNWVVLDDKDWRRASHKFGNNGQTGTAFTVRDIKTVFLNGATCRPCDHRCRLEPWRMNSDTFSVVVAARWWLTRSHQSCRPVPDEKLGRPEQNPQTDERTRRWNRRRV